MAVFPAYVYFNALSKGQMTDKGEMKYSLTVFWPKAQRSVWDKAIKPEVDAAIKKGISSEKFSAASVKLPAFTLPVRDGDDAVAADPQKKETHSGMLYMNIASQLSGPCKVFDKEGNEIMPSELYRGQAVLINAQFWPFKFKGNLGVGKSLRAVKMHTLPDLTTITEGDAYAAFADYVE